MRTINIFVILNLLSINKSFHLFRFFSMFFFFFLALPWGMWDFISLTRDRTCAPCSGKCRVLTTAHWTGRQVPQCISIKFYKCFPIDLPHLLLDIFLIILLLFKILSLVFSNFCRYGERQLICIH